MPYKYAQWMVLFIGKLLSRGSGMCFANVDAALLLCVQSAYATIRPYAE